MSKLVWDKRGERYFQNGVSHCVLYSKHDPYACDPGVMSVYTDNDTQKYAISSPWQMYQDENGNQNFMPTVARSTLYGNQYFDWNFQITFPTAECLNKVVLVYGALPESYTANSTFEEWPFDAINEANILKLLHRDIYGIQLRGFEKSIRETYDHKYQLRMLVSLNSGASDIIYNQNQKQFFIKFRDFHGTDASPNHLYGADFHQAYAYAHRYINPYSTPSITYYSDEKGVYDFYSGYVWNGITSVTESPDGAEPNDLYADNMKYSTLRSKEVFNGTIEAYTYPEAFEFSDGTAVPVKGVKVNQQWREPFCLSYRTRLNSDIDPSGDGYLLHLVYNCTASPSELSYETINDSPDAITFSWEFNTSTINIGNFSGCTITIDSTKVEPNQLASLERILYGGDNAGELPVMPSPNKVLEIFEQTTEEEVDDPDLPDPEVAGA